MFSEKAHVQGLAFKKGKKVCKFMRPTGGFDYGASTHVMGQSVESGPRMAEL
jgi:hypothetical protein